MPARSESPLRVHLAIGSLGIGGAEKQLVELAIALAARGHDVSVLVLAGRGERLHHLEAAGVRVVSLLDESERPRTSLAAPVAVVKLSARALREFRVSRPVVVHAWMLHAFLLLLPLAWLARVPVRLQGRRSMRAGLSERAWITAALALTRVFTTGVTANARAMRQELCESERFEPAQVRFIANSVRIPTGRADTGVQPARGVLVARFAKEKAHEVLLHALAKTDHPPRLVLVGDGPRLQEMQELSKALDLRDCLEFAGGCADATDFQLAAQFAVLCSRTEGTPNVVLEAMAAGLPTIATDVGGVRELIVEGRNGVLVPPDDPAALAEALERIGYDADLRVAMGNAAREMAAGWSVDTIAEQYLSFYQEQLALASWKSGRH